MSFYLSDKKSFNDVKRNVTLPSKYSFKFIEFLGILTGDGYINYYPKSSGYIIEISGNYLTDREYLLGYVSKLIKTLFNIYPCVYFSKREKCMYLRIKSKLIFQFLKSCNFPEGKKGQILIPEFIKNSNSSMVAFTRGFFDTDGSLSIKKSKRTVIHITSISKFLMLDIRDWLISRGYTVSFCKSLHLNYKSNSTLYDIYLSSKSSLFLWFSDIGSNNIKHIKKWEKIKWAERDLNLIADI